MYFLFMNRYICILFYFKFIQDIGPSSNWWCKKWKHYIIKDIIIFRFNMGHYIDNITNLSEFRKGRLLFLQIAKQLHHIISFIHCIVSRVLQSIEIRAYNGHNISLIDRWINWEFTQATLKVERKLFSDLVRGNNYENQDRF